MAGCGCGGAVIANYSGPQYSNFGYGLTPSEKEKRYAAQSSYANVTGEQLTQSTGDIKETTNSFKDMLNILTGKEPYKMEAEESSDSLPVWAWIAGGIVGLVIVGYAVKKFF